MIRILFLIHDLGGGGAERVLANLVNNLDPEKYDVTLISLFGGVVNEKLICGRVKYKSVFRKTFPGNSYVMRLFSPKTLHKLFIKEKYDIEVSFLEGPSARIISGCPDKDVKLVSWFHTCFPDEKKLAEGFNGIKEAEKCFHRFDRLICVSETVKSAVKSIIPSLDTLSVIYNINESEIITERSKEQITQGMLADSGVNIVSVGRLIPEKGYERLAKVHKKLRDEGFDIHTYI
ncbi:MAG: glycosyltransferase, partial [Firmicutes bacterium]|nr:glycosyltransferase [Candidatus Colimorpha enterica]